VKRRPIHHHQPGGGQAWMQRAMVWPIRSLKVLLVGITTCGLGWFWLAFYLYVEWRRERQRPPHARAQKQKSS